MKTKLSTEQVVKILRKLEKGWPSNLWLFAGDSSLSLMDKKNGERAIHPNISHAFDPAFIVESFPKIESEGGGF
jgi:hypothetical protein